MKTIELSDYDYYKLRALLSDLSEDYIIKYDYGEEDKYFLMYDCTKKGDDEFDINIVARDLLKKLK